MGLLDDAIREHLELKRNHGAAEEDLRRQETEALGPARRDFAPAATSEAVEESPPAAEPEPREPAGWLDDEPGTAPFDVEPVEASAPPPPPPVEPVEPAAPPPVEPAQPVAESAPPPARKSDTPTQGFPAVSRDDAEDEGDEDVLEETPDFLQDTPEHDRLWFEQKPPRDFDFDD